MYTQGVITIIKKKYIEEKDVVESLLSLRNVYEKSVQNILKMNDLSLLNKIQSLNEKVVMINDVINFVKNLKLEKLENGYTYNLRVKEVDNKYVHTLTIEKIEKDNTNNIIKEFISNIENV